MSSSIINIDGLICIVMELCAKTVVRRNERITRVESRLITAAL